MWGGDDCPREMTSVKLLRRRGLATGLGLVFVAVASAGALFLLDRVAVPVSARELLSDYPPGITWTSTFVVQNRGSTTATIQVDFYSNPTGTVLAAASQVLTAGPGGSAVVRPANISGLTSNSRYGAVVASDQPIASIVNLFTGDEPRMLSSYSNVLSPTTTAYLPDLARDYAGFNTPFSIQNASSSVGTYTVSLYKTADGSLAYTTAVVLAAGAPYEVGLTTLPASVSAVPSSTQYSGVVTGTQAVAAVVNKMSSGTAGAYAGFASGAGQWFLPDLARNYVGYNTPWVIQNVDTAAASLVITYLSTPAGTLALTKTVTGLGPGLSSIQRPHTESGLVDGAQYAAIVSSDKNVAVMVNKVGSASTDISIYNAVSQGSTTVYLPDVTRNYVGYNTPFVIQNTGSTTATVTVTYYNADTGALETAVSGISAGPGRSTIRRPQNEDGLADGRHSVVVTSTQPVGVIVNKVNNSSGAVSMYEGIAGG